MFIANYHTHTKRCGHAKGEDEEYVLEALGHGLRYLGFSDHAMLPGFSEPYRRGDFSMFDDYVNSINALKEKYKDQITIYLGFEAGMYKVFAHPDYFMMSIENFDSDCKKISKEMIEACIAYDIPLEINLAGIRNGPKRIGRTKRFFYPTDDFFSLVSKYHAKCIFGDDAHAPSQIADSSAQFEAVSFAKKHDLVIIDRLENISQH